MLKQRSRPQDRKNSAPKAFGGLLKCSCGMGITAEIQKGYIYYRCTRKSKTVKCVEPFVREEELDKQIAKLLQKFSLKKDWAEQLLCLLEKDKNTTAQSFTAFVQEKEKEISAIKTKLQRLLDGYLEQDIERETYRNEKAKLMSEKKTLEEKTTTLEQKQTGWIEPMSEWIKEARNLPKIARETNLFAKKVAAKEIFGSNFILSAHEARAKPQKQWAALSAAPQNLSKKSESLFLVHPAGFEPATLKLRASCSTN